MQNAAVGEHQGRGGGSGRTVGQVAVELQRNDLHRSSALVVAGPSLVKDDVPSHADAHCALPWSWVIQVRNALIESPPPHGSQSARHDAHNRQERQPRRAASSAQCVSAARRLRTLSRESSRRRAAWTRWSRRATKTPRWKRQLVRIDGAASTGGVDLTLMVSGHSLCGLRCVLALEATGPARHTNRAGHLLLFAIPQSSKIATARVNPAEALRILKGKQEIMKPVGGRLSRLASFSMWQ